MMLEQRYPWLQVLTRGLAKSLIVLPADADALVDIRMHERMDFAATLVDELAYDVAPGAAGKGL